MESTKPGIRKLVRILPLDLRPAIGGAGGEMPTVCERALDWLYREGPCSVSCPGLFTKRALIWWYRRHNRLRLPAANWLLPGAGRGISKRHYGNSPRVTRKPSDCAS